MKVYGVCNHSPDFLFVWLKKLYSVSSSEIYILPENDFLTVRPRKNVKIVFFLSNRSFRRNLEIVNSKHYKNISAILFASPIDIHSYENIFPLDFMESDDIHLDAFLLQSLNKKRFSFSADSSLIERNKTDYLQNVLEHLKSFGSLLNPLMTFVYTLPSGSHQKPVKEMVCRWLYEDSDISELEKSLDKVSVSMSFSSKQKKRLIDILSSDVARKYKNALAEYKRSVQNEETIYKIVYKWSVSAYELRYILSIVKSESK